MITDPTPWQNSPPWDVNDDGEVHPDDVLRLINDINARDVRSLPFPPIAPDVPPPYLDPSGDNWSVNVRLGRYHCFRCGSHGNALELWAAVHHLSVYAAAVDLCQQLSLEIPWVRRW